MSRNFGVIEEMSRRGTEELSVEWRIPNFPSLLNGRGYWNLSPVFSFGNEHWRLLMCPNWEREEWNPASGWVRLDLFRLDGGQPETFRFSVGIMGSRGVEKNRDGEKEFEGCYDSYDWDDFCSRSDLLEHRTRLMPYGRFTITCVLKRIASVGDACTQTDCNLDAKVFSGVKKSTEKSDGEKVVEDMTKFLASGEKSDIAIHVGDVEFQVHSFILFAQCPALSVSLQHESRGRTSKRKVIEDCQPDVFREFLRHLYTGSIRSLTEQNVFGLYRLADKYHADDLKQLCLEHIKETLSVQTFCDAIKLALTYKESDLLQRATDFAAQNIQSILVSAEWQNFNCENPRQANDILTKCFGA